MSFRTQWHDFKRSSPGRRFHDFYEQRKTDRSPGHQWRRLLIVGMGLVIAVGGIILLGMPGPGLLVVALGLALVSSESEMMAKGLDRLEVGLRGAAEKFLCWWQRLSPVNRTAFIVAALLMVLSLGGLAYKMLV